MYTNLLMFALSLSLSSAQASLVPSLNTTNTPVRNVTRYPGIALRLENLAIRPDGQILWTSASPNASVYQTDPLGILPPVLIYTISDIGSATGITEGAPDIYYVASGNTSIFDPTITYPDTYLITEINMNGVSVKPDGSLTRSPAVRHIASIPDGDLLNGIAFSRLHSDNLLVSDSYRGLIWNVNVCDGTVGVTLNDTTTKGPASVGPQRTGVNGIKVLDGMMYWTNTGAASMYKVPIDRAGNVRDAAKPSLVTGDLTCDDFAFDWEGNAFVAGPLDVITKVSPSGQKEVVAGSLNSTTSDLVGPTAVRFGRLASDRWSMYVTTNGGVGQNVPGAAGISRLDASASSS